MAMERSLWRVILLSLIPYAIAFELSFDGQPNVANIPKTYDKNFRPNHGAVEDVLSISVDSLSVRGIDEVGSKFITDLTLRTSWTDPRLKDTVNKSTTFVGILPNIWFPPLFIVDASDETFGQSIQIKPEGEIVLTERHVAEVHCQFSFMKLPFDIQDCGIRFKTHAFSTLSLDMVWNGRIVESSVRVYDSQFSLSSVTQMSHKEVEMAGEFRILTVGIKLSRNPFRHFKLIMLPGLVFAILSYFTLFLREDSSADTENSSPNLQLGLIRTIFSLTLFLVYQIMTQMYYVAAGSSGALTACDIWIFAASTLQLFLFIYNLLVFTHSKNPSWHSQSEEKKPPCFQKFGKLLTMGIPIASIVFLIIYFLVCLI